MPSPVDLPVAYIDTFERLHHLCQQLESEKYLAIDTEFVREKTYYPVFCLMQIATPRHLACIDPLRIPDLQPLKHLLTQQSILKVFHSAGQDLEVLYNAFHIMPSPLFDTQLAANMLGQGEQIAYAGLVKQLLGVNLDKSQSRTDWLRRPLSAAQIQYAADDVRYLVGIYARQLQQLQNNGRTAWLKEDFERLTDPQQFSLSADDLLNKVKGVRHLNREELNRVNVLATWREQQAQNENKPRKWILRDEVMTALAKLDGGDDEALASCLQDFPAIAKRYGKDLRQQLLQAAQLPPAQWPAAPVNGKPDPAETSLIECILAIVKRTAEQHAFPASVLASRKAVEQLVRGKKVIPLMQGWRYELAGKQIEALLLRSRQ